MNVLGNRIVKLKEQKKQENYTLYRKVDISLFCMQEKNNFHDRYMDKNCSISDEVKNEMIRKFLEIFLKTYELGIKFFRMYLKGRGTAVFCHGIEKLI